MARLIMMVGLPGAGKTTLAKQLEIERPALRLTPDEWISTLYGAHLPKAQLEAIRDPIEAIAWKIATQALAIGTDVILDFGFWTQGEREGFRDRAAALGAESEIVFCDCEKVELLRRLEMRNANSLPDQFAVTAEETERWWLLFEPPTPDELPVRTVS